MSADPTARGRTYLGLFVVTLAALTYEILLTRIFSVTMWYHFSFMAISLAMFGMSAGAVIVYLLPGVFTPERAHRQLALSALLFGVSIVLSFLTHLCIPMVVEPTVVGVYSIALLYVVISVPFVFSGVCVCLALTRFGRQVGRLYAADLAGAAAGSILLIYLLKVTDAPTAAFATAALAALAAALFAAAGGEGRLRRAAVACCVGLGCFAAASSAQGRTGRPWVRLVWVKGMLEPTPLYEKWNSFSRVRVDGDPQALSAPSGWGLSAAWGEGRRVRQLYMTIDAAAGTVLTGYDGDEKEVEHLKYDVVNIAHWLRSDASVFVVGSGGGRDVLAALAFGQRRVVAVEINEDIIAAVNGTFGDFTGHLDRDPRVTFVNDEARSYLTRQTERFDIIQVSLIDTWAATAAGAFVLTENSIYTVEAWKVFLEHLTPGGMLSFSRWYYAGSSGEMYRLASLARAALGRLGVSDPRKHVAIVRNRTLARTAATPDGVGTILVSRTPLSDADLDRIERTSRRMRFQVVLSPREAFDPHLGAIASGADLGALSDRLGLNLVPPTDDSPFFFNMLRLRDIHKRGLWQQGPNTFNMRAVFILGVLVVVVVCLTVLCLLVPLASKTGKAPLGGSASLLVFFACIGLGFMLVEISQMQRLIVFLGHPTYGLSVVLFALLLSAGAGSYTVGRDLPAGGGRLRLLVLLGVLAAFGAITPSVIRWFAASVTPVRILVAVGVLLPLGFFMGMAFPLGMRLAGARSAGLTPWLWGVNGATSVCGSVFAVAIALGWGISGSFWTGLSCYVVAFVAFLLAGRRPAAATGPS